MTPTPRSTLRCKTRHARGLTGSTTRTDSGFTLVECLLALSILAMFVALLPSTVRLAKRATSFGVTLSNDTSHDAAKTAVERMLTEAMALIVKDQDGALRVAFAGGPDSVRFVAPLLTAPEGAGLYLVTLRTSVRGVNPNTRDASRAALTMTATPVLNDASAGFDASAPQQEPAIRDLASGTGATGFRYFGAAVDGAPAEWMNIWPRNDRLPDLVEITWPRRSNVRDVSLVQIVELMLRQRRADIAR